MEMKNFLPLNQGDLVMVFSCVGIADKDMETYERKGPRYSDNAFRRFDKKTTAIVIGDKPKYVDYHNNNSVAFAYYKLLMSTNEVVWVRQSEIFSNTK